MENPNIQSGMESGEEFLEFPLYLHTQYLSIELK